MQWTRIASMAVLAAGTWLLCATTTQARQQQASIEQLVWHDDYRDAYHKAKQEERMLLIMFVSDRTRRLPQAIEQRFTEDAELNHLARECVLAKLSVDDIVQVDGEQITLLKHASMAEMHGFPGLAIVDLKHQDEAYYGHVVSAFPFMVGKYYRFRLDYLPVIMNLPRGTITQRTMVWAVRIHPERPASTKGVSDSTLAREANSHSSHQAKIGVQGHHRWEGRFHRIRRLLGGRRTPIEVVAESWPSQNMIDSCIDCVHSWRQSSGHWNAVKSQHAVYAYDIKRGSNGIWYGTGLFAN